MKLKPYILIGIALALMFWVSESTVHHYSLDQAFISGFFPFDVHELWMRSFIVVLFLSFGYVAQRLEDERIQAIAERSDERYRQMVERSPEAIGIHQYGKWVYVNAAAIKLFGGIDASEFIGKPVLDFVHPDSQADVLGSIRQLMSNGGSTLAIEERLVRLNGESFMAEVNALMVSHEEAPAVMVLGRDIDEQKRWEDELNASLQTMLAAKTEADAACLREQEQAKLLEAFYSHTHDSVALLDKDFNFIRVNDAYARSDEKEVDYFPGKNHFDLYPSDAIDIFREVVRTKQPYSVTSRAFVYPEHPERGTTYWDWNLTPVMDDKDREIKLLIFTLRNVTDRHEAEAALIHANRALRTLSACNSTLVRATSEAGLLDEMCRVIVETGGYQMAWVGFAHDDADKTVLPVAQSGYEEGYLENANITWADTEQGHGPTGTAIRTGVPAVNQNVLTNPDMAPWREAAVRRGYQSSIGLPLKIGGRVMGALTIYAAEPSAFTTAEVTLLEELAGDLSFGISAQRLRIEHEVAAKEVEYLAHHDILTGLPNLLLLRDRFDLAGVSANRAQVGVALLILDLDNFKQINDSLGHGIGDQLLVCAVQRLQGIIRSTDTISRQSGDEFVVLLGDVSTPEIVETIAQHIIEAFGEPFEISGHIMSITFSIGIGMFPNDGRDFETLFKHADTALFQAKDAGKNTYRFFTEKMNIDAIEHMHLQGQLRSALKRGEFVLHYQPQLDTTSGRIIGTEALLRWQHPELGLVPPGKFIPLAERSGLIVPIGEWVIHEACRQAQQWMERDRLQAMVVAVNLSALQFKRGNIVETVASALKQSGLPARYLELELTESILLHDIDIVMTTLKLLKEIGVKLSIDDFGTGYSSLSYLKRLKVDKLKVDQSFVRDMVQDAEDAAIVKAVVQLGHNLQLTVIAEGVENNEQFALLKSYGCDEVQGYLFSRPIPAAEFAEFCKLRTT
ncbi:MAG: EAL domain-containing protein [Sideroxydans sp.]|nr:EAL domain-containing protein [Sideroxydans sp.]